MKLYDLPELARDSPAEIALVWHDRPSAPRWTYAEFASRVAGVAQALAERRLPAGAAVAAVGGNHPAWVLLQEACAWLKLTFVPIGPKLAPAERDFLIRNSGATLTLGDPQIAQGHEPVESWDWCDEARSEMFPSRPATAPGYQLLYTSGSGGVPKGVLRERHSDDARIRQSIEAYRLTSAAHNLVAGPLYHSGPSIFFRIFRRMGTTQTVLGHFDPATVARLIASGNITAIFMVPTMWRMLLDELQRTALRPKLTHAFIAGSATETDLRRDLIAALGEGVLWEFYGATETGTVAILPPEKQHSHAQTVGFPPPETEVRIVGDDGRDLPIGSTGRIYVKSPTSMAGYHRGQGSSPDLREDTLPGGWVSVGDLGHLTHDGAVVLLGREQGMIISGGINVYPEEVEAALKKLPGVLEAVAFGLPDKIWGQKICALVEPMFGETLSAEKLRGDLRESLAGYKIPKELKVTKIPRTASEKVARSADVLKNLL